MHGSATFFITSIHICPFFSENSDDFRILCEMERSPTPSITRIDIGTCFN